MKNQTLSNQNFIQLKTTLSLYFLTLGACLSGFSVYLFLESLNYSSQTITSWTGQSLFWSFILFFTSLFILFLPIEFFSSFNLINNSFRDLISNILITILVSLFFLIFFQISIPKNTLIFTEVISITRATSFSGFVVIPVIIFILNNLGQKFSKLNKFAFSIVLLIWILASQFFLWFANCYILSAGSIPKQWKISLIVS